MMVKNIHVVPALTILTFSWRRHTYDKMLIGKEHADDKDSRIGVIMGLLF